MQYCPNCGNPVVVTRPQGDDRERHVCQHCDSIHYENPKIITGFLPVFEDKVLLCKRAIEPRYGLWTLPAGFMENGETSEEGALRESWEEARAKIKSHGLYTLFNLPHINQVYLFYRGTLSDLDFRAGPESLDVQLFKQDEIPWEQVAFTVVKKTLHFYFHDFQQKYFPVRTEDVHISPGSDSSQISNAGSS